MTAKLYTFIILSNTLLCLCGNIAHKLDGWYSSPQAGMLMTHRSDESTPLTNSTSKPLVALKGAAVQSYTGG